MALSPRALDAAKSRERRPTSWYLDLALIASYWGDEHVYHHTAPVSMILGLREGLRSSHAASSATNASGLGAS